MVFLLRRCLLPSLRLAQTRTLRTRPRSIPSYIPQWNPALHVPIHSRDADESAPQTAGSGRRRANRRLSYLLGAADTPTALFDTALPASLRKEYIAAKAADSGIIWRLPLHIWDILWKTQAQEWPIRRSGVAHLYQLSRDRLAVGKPVTPRQWAQYVEVMFLGGEEEKAMAIWEEQYKATPCDGAHLEVGAKLHALAGSVDRAREILEKLFEVHQYWDTSVMTTVFRAHTSSELSEHHEIAKELYVKMRERKRKILLISDYDAWLVGFMEARSLRHAMQVFTDMVKDGCLATTGTANDVNEILRRLQMLYRLAIDTSEMTSIVLDAMSILPLEYHTHLFGDWIKSTIVAQKPLVAAQVLDTMFIRGYAPNTYHFNMLIRGLLRTKDEASMVKAENIGWNMIEQTHKHNSVYREPGSTARIISQQAAQHSTSPNGLGERSFPPANTSTFALIMQHHAKAVQWEHVEYLARRFEDTSLALNVTIMNVLMDNKCRQGAYASAWEIYTSHANPQKGTKGIFPDGATFRMLWKILRLSLGDYATRDDPRMPSPRELLKEMVTWSSLIRGRYDVEQFRQGLAGSDRRAITKLVMHCFSYTQDLAGSLVALHVLYEEFNIRPTSKAAEILQRQIAWVDLGGESNVVRSQFRMTQSSVANLARVQRVYDIIVRRRMERMIEEGINYEILTLEERGDVGLNLLSEFVRVVMSRSYSPEQVEAMIQEAKEFIGLPQLPTGDMNAFEVA